MPGLLGRNFTLDKLSNLGDNDNMTASSIRTVKQIASTNQFEVEPTIAGTFVVVDTTHGRPVAERLIEQDAIDLAQGLNEASVSPTALRRAFGAFNSVDEAADWSHDEVACFA